MLTRFAQVFPNHGFDGAPKPPWVMVRQGNFNWAYMLGDQKVTLKLTKPGIVKVVPQNTAYRFTNAGVEFKKTNKKAQVLRLEGLTAGTVFVEAYNGATRVARLEVAVKKKKMLKVAFNFVQDSGGHTTTRKQGHVDRWVKNVNRILEPQANVSVVKGKVGSVTVSKNLGSVVKVTKWRGRPKDEMPDVTKHRDAKADINVFLVWQLGMPGTWEVDGVQHGKDIILEDKAGKQFSESLAHEIVHVMGPGDLKKGKKLLMYQYTTIRGRKLPKRHANTINP